MPRSDYSQATPDLVRVTRKVNVLGNMAAYNPRGAEDAGASGRDEGYLYWLGWFSHNGASLWNGQDAHGPMRRLYTTGELPEPDRPAPGQPRRADRRRNRDRVRNAVRARGSVRPMNGMGA